jgi:phage FluMu protein Com
VTQVSFAVGVFNGVKHPPSPDPGQMTVLVPVRCLECGEVYAKPRRGGTVEKNPGCPNCGYVGWLSVSLPTEKPSGLRRSGEDPLPRRRVRRG